MVVIGAIRSVIPIPVMINVMMGIAAIPLPLPRTSANIALMAATAAATATVDILLEGVGVLVKLMRVIRVLVIEITVLETCARHRVLSLSLSLREVTPTALPPVGVRLHVAGVVIGGVQGSSGRGDGDGRRRREILCSEVCVYCRRRRQRRGRLW